MAKERRPSPLWRHMPARAYVPPTGPKAPNTGFSRSRTDVTEQDLNPLRVDDHWGVMQILDGLPKAQDPSESLGLLLVAAAATQGPARLLEIVHRSAALLRQALPRLLQLSEGPGLPHRSVVETLADGTRWALDELPELRTRAENEMDVDVQRPYGLRPLDLRVLAAHLRTAVGAHEMTRRPTLAGVAFGRRLFEGAPNLEFGQTWTKRILPSAPLRDVQLYWPSEYARLLLVFDDGRLAYDPGDPGETPE